MIAVVGGGPAGRTAAIRLANGGAEVLLIDKGGLGGQCLHHGCMVVSALSDIARLLDSARQMERLGIIDRVPEIDFPCVLAEMRNVQATIRRVLEEETRSAGVEICSGKEAFVDGRKLILEGEERETAAILIATGSKPAVPAIPGAGLPGVITPHTLGELEKLPGRIAIVGGGVVAAEFAYIFRQFGSEVEILCRSEFLKHVDERVRRSARAELADVGIEENAPVDAIERAGNTLHVEVRNRPEREVDAVLLAAGLEPNTALVRGIEKGQSGAILVDAKMRTSVPGVYAAGDVTGGPYLTPVARRQGTIAADAILGRPAGEERLPPVPQTIKLRNDHTFCDLAGSEEIITFGFPSPSGSGSFWWVPERYTGSSSLTIEPDGRIVGFYAGAPCTSLLGPYLAYLLRDGVGVEALEDLVEVHPSTDGIYGLIRYAANWLNRQPRA
ncbi:MAG: NAD(P)/FAD-dependent oxidoreductase [Methanomicrobiaceae archaeon]|nr:NAD(P)/FAD-dependent oxidoreductase [Methanomicrobiaceae archaeon]